ncbi:lysine-N-methylase [Brevibacillus fluminis]|uniref:Lysine-N-methylase n=2 Tax=Brevibacillus fluminis TaxID=511487 RepID=A0A3M8DYQ9_9BACL|nr:lysine-N-methylase [Brevibacillus fluminis]
MSQFACIGSACEDTCCVGWRVNVDKNTYRNYKKIENPELKLILDKHVKRNRSNPNDSTYAKIVLGQDGVCPLLTEEKLCKVQQELGESYLSNICATYPRIANEVNGVFEQSATMSCPEVARLALLNPDGIEFNEVEEEFGDRLMFTNIINTNKKLMKNKIEHYFWELRIFTIQVLQNRDYPLADRLIMLGMFFHKADEYVKTGRSDELPALIASYTNLINEGSIRDNLTDIPVNYAIQMELLKELADERFFAGINNQRYFDCFAAFLHGIEYTLEDKIEEIAERYHAAYENHYLPVMSQHEYVLENYLVNYVFKNMFPMSKYESVYDEFVVMVLHYALIKMNLIGMAGHYKEGFNLDLVIKLIQSFAKTVEHSKIFLGHAFDLLEKNNYKTLAYMSILIKN